MTCLHLAGAHIHLCFRGARSHGKLACNDGVLVLMSMYSGGPSLRRYMEHKTHLLNSVFLTTYHIINGKLLFGRAVRASNVTTFSRKAGYIGRHQQNSTIQVNALSTSHEYLEEKSWGKMIAGSPTARLAWQWPVLHLMPQLLQFHVNPTTRKKW